MKKEIQYEVSSGNVFADLGLPNPEELLAKAELTSQITTLIKKKNLTRAAAAKLLKIDQQKLSALISGKLLDFPIEEFFNFLNLLGQDVVIRIKPKTKSKKKADISVTLPMRKKTTVKIPHADAISIQAKKKNKRSM